MKQSQVSFLANLKKKIRKEKGVILVLKSIFFAVRALWLYLGWNGYALAYSSTRVESEKNLK